MVEVIPETVNVPSVPTDVKLDVTTVAFNVVPVNVPAAAVTVADAPSAILVPLTVSAPEPTNALFGILLKFVPVSVGVVVQEGAPAVSASTPVAAVLGQSNQEWRTPFCHAERRPGCAQ